MTPGFYSVIPSTVRYDKELSANAKLMYGEITALCSSDGVCWASNKYFCELYKVNESTVVRWLNQLKSKGYIFINYKFREGTRSIQNRIIKLVDSTVGVEEIIKAIGLKKVDEVVSKMQVPLSTNPQGVLAEMQMGYLQNCVEGTCKNARDNIIDYIDRDIRSINILSRNEEKVKLWKNDFLEKCGQLQPIEQNEKHLFGEIKFDEILCAILEKCLENKNYVYFFLNGVTTTLFTKYVNIMHDKKIHNKTKYLNEVIRNDFTEYFKINQLNDYLDFRDEFAR